MERGQKMRVLIFGDSTTQGFWDSQGGWVERLRKYFDARHISGQDDDTPAVFNLGVSADASDNLLERFNNEAKARNRDELAIVFDIGCNDARTKEGKNYTEVETYTGNLAKLLKQAQTYTKKILFVGLTPCVEERSNPVSWSNTGYTNARNQLFDKALQGFCKENDVPYVPVFEDFAKRQAQEELLPDGIHPNDAGHQLIADIVRPKLEELLK
jgi:lysophospholipase L1-like esterase